VHVALVGLVWRHGSTVIEHMTVGHLKLLCTAYGHKYRLKSLDVGQLEVTGIQCLTEGQQPTQYAAAGLVNVLWVCCIGH
jgi:hypothetical protein